VRNPTRSIPRDSLRPGRRAAVCAALIIACVAVFAFVGGASLQAASRQDSSPSDGARREVFDDPFDGIWVGILQASASGTKRPYPMLVNLNARGASGDGLMLLADELAGAPSHLEFMPLVLEVKGKKLKLTAAAAENSRTRSLAATLRLKGDALKGTLTSSDEGFKKSRVELRRLAAGEPLQQLWSGTLPDARGVSQLVALTFWVDGSVSGGGFVGSAFGNLKRATVANGRLTALLATADGNIDIDVMVGRKGQLGGSVDGRPLDRAPLAPGSTSRTPTIRKLKPSTLPAGVTTTVAITGKNLATGFLLHTNIEGVYSGVPQVISARKATVALTVAADVAAGTAVQLHVAAANGEVDTSRARLTTGGKVAVSFVGDLLPILTTRCAVEGCHVQPPLNDPAYPDGEAPAGLVMEGPVAFANLVNVPSTERPELDRIEPFDAERSYLVKKLRGDADILGGRMPQDGPPFLSPEMIDMFIRWVEAGATRN